MISKGHDMTCGEGLSGHLFLVLGAEGGSWRSSPD